jgi:aspartate-semialdehyde dehydrogenase
MSGSATASAGISGALGRRTEGNRGYCVAVVGATGLVGRALLTLLEERNFPILQLKLFASERSLGQELIWKGHSVRLQVLQPGCFEGVDWAFFDASDAVSADWVPAAARAGAWVIDNSATFRLDPEVPLVVPEVNGKLLDPQILLKNQSFRGESAWKARVISGPNCSTVQMVLALKPLSDRWGLKRVVVSTYQSTSGAGAAAIQELAVQSRSLLLDPAAAVLPQVFPHQIGFNCLPHIGRFLENGNTSEEQKMILESRKILGLADLKVSATTVRVPTFSCHSESINVELKQAFLLPEVRQALQEQPGVILQDDPGQLLYPLSVRHEEGAGRVSEETDLGLEAATGRDGVYVGRVRIDASVDHGLNLWVVSDNLRKGAALNAIQIAEVLESASSRE